MKFHFFVIDTWDIWWPFSRNCFKQIQIFGHCEILAQMNLPVDTFLENQPKHDHLCPQMYGNKKILTWIHMSMKIKFPTGFQCFFFVFFLCIALKEWFNSNEKTKHHRFYSQKLDILILVRETLIRKFSC